MRKEEEEMEGSFEGDFKELLRQFVLRKAMELVWKDDILSDKGQVDDVEDV